MRPEDGSVHVADVTSQYACYGVWGPSARTLLQPLTTTDLSNATFPYMRARELAIGRVPCLALRVTYVGELGWELYCRSEFGLALWDTIWEAGREHDLVAGGYKAIDSLRLEKGYRVWGADITPEDSPFEAGLGFAVKLDKGEFTGRDALAAAGEPERVLRCVTLNDPRAIALGSEPVRVGERPRGPGHERRLRLHGGEVDRVRVPACRARGGDRGRGRDLRRVGAGRHRRGAAVRRAGRADPRVTFAAEVERVWPGRGASFEVLGGGITNHNLKVEVDGERFVLRVAGKDTGLLGIDRTVELAATQAAAALGIGPEVVEFVEPEGWLVTRFVEGEIPALERMREPAMLARVARALRAFHDGDRRSRDPSTRSASSRATGRRRSSGAAACRMRTTGRTRWRRGSRRRARRTPPFRATTTS